MKVPSLKAASPPLEEDFGIVAVSEEAAEGLGMLGLASRTLLDPQMRIPPLNWAMVAPGVYRGGYPIACNFPFLQDVGLRSILCLCPDRSRLESDVWCERQNIRLMCIHVGDNIEPFVSMDEEGVAKALDFVSDTKNHPILVHCLNGKNRTGCVIGCLRRIEGWSLTAIFDEYSHFAGTAANLLDLQFIELWHRL